MVAAALFAIAGAIYWQRAVDQRINGHDVAFGLANWLALSIVAVVLIAHECWKAAT